MIADSVGLGKTWIGKKLLEDFAYHMRQKAVVVCPASLREMWEAELRDATIEVAEKFLRQHNLTVAGDQLVIISDIRVGDERIDSVQLRAAK